MLIYKIEDINLTTQSPEEEMEQKIQDSFYKYIASIRVKEPFIGVDENGEILTWKRFAWEQGNPEFADPNTIDFDKLTNHDTSFITDIMDKRFTIKQSRLTTSGEMLKTYNSRMNFDENGKANPYYPYTDECKQLVISWMAHIKRVELNLADIDLKRSARKDIVFLEYLKDKINLTQDDSTKVFVSNSTELSWYKKRALDLYAQYFDSAEGRKELMDTAKSIKANFFTFVDKLDKESKAYFLQRYEGWVDNVFAQEKIKIKESNKVLVAEKGQDPNYESNKTQINQWLEFVSTCPNKHPNLIKIKKDAVVLIPKGYAHKDLVSLKNRILEFIKYKI